MSTVFTVQADSEEEALSARERMCAALGLVPIGKPIDLGGRGRWMARAETAKPLPHGGRAGTSTAD